jgi:arylsulfatase A-like enzyme
VIAAPAASPGSRPNILWVTCEDMSPTLGCYGDTYADTPAIDQLAREGVRYTQAFASAPVCSPVRSGIITGHYATSLGTQRLRSTFPVPADVRPFPEALRHAGYFCANNVKTDYNLYDESAFIRAAWDESSAQAHWRNRPVGRPFFAVVNLMTTHQSRTSVWPVGQFEEEVAFRLKPEERHDPVKAPLPPYYPATAEVRRAVARHYDCVSVMDREVSLLLRQLEEDDLADNTIVFFYSDHGSGLPRGKRVLHDSGLQIPLIIRFPERFRHLAPGAPGTISARLVSTIDLGPTVLALAGLPVAASLQGRPFLGGSATAPRRALFGARDRVDEAFDVSRAVREDHFLYIRNFMPHQSWMPPEAYSDQSPMRRELKRLAAAGELNAAQLTYAAPRRAREELYDTAHDPHQIHNLAGDPEHEGTLLRLRATLQNWILETRDAGFAPEAEAAALTSSAGPPRHWACADEFYPLGQLLAAADLVGRPGAEPVQIALLSASNPCLRYWGAVGLHAAEQISADGRAALHQALADPAPEVRIEAAAALVAQDNSADGLNVLQRELGSDSAEVVLAAARSLELLGDDAAGARSALRHALDLAENRDGDLWMFVRFSLNAALEGR